jgi:hypothetical protein
LNNSGHTDDDDAEAPVAAVATPCSGSVVDLDDIE